jgi:hypothetical protein
MTQRIQNPSLNAESSFNPYPPLHRFRKSTVNPEVDRQAFRDHLPYSNVPVLVSGIGGQTAPTPDQY